MLKGAFASLQHLHKNPPSSSSFAKTHRFQLYVHGEKPALTKSKPASIQILRGAISFPKTILGNRQRRTWERLISYIESSDSPSAFDKAASYIEGYVHALVDSDQIHVSIERDLLIIETVDAWRCTRTESNTSPYLNAQENHDFLF
ncbi:hypothetical protein PflSS101_2714 [Pseudomonas lactis]|uniref:Uncharacterized protein n=1 Tax=Pseudomonas lactis TaxID=1615674 RepID=I4KB18_9PSED|nr:hypothetical protein PflSS101_2714 [Pseudomonas lactis]